MRVGILDILALPSRDLGQHAFGFLYRKQYASIMPQAVSVWCRQMGHETFYATYYGAGDVGRLLPDDLDVLFVSTFTQASPLAYAVSKLCRSRGTTTVIGGPHARSFPLDCLRFFDLVVRECNRELVSDVLAGRFAPGSLISSDRPVDAEIPPVEERLPEIRSSSFVAGRALPIVTIPLLTSLGCPYTCDFCMDWSSRYRVLPKDRITTDLKFVSQRFPKVMLQFHDPNFGVRFDEVLDCLESIPPRARNPYMIESSLSNLRPARLHRLRDTGCIAVQNGIESWFDYSNKSVNGGDHGRQKLERTVAKLEEISEHVPFIQANMIFGLDCDQGEEPAALTRELIRRAPFAWPSVFIPTPFGGTPLFDRWRAAGRIHEALPFLFYLTPYLAIRIQGYDVLPFYRELLAIEELAASFSTLRRRIGAARSWIPKVTHVVRTQYLRGEVAQLRGLVRQIEADARLRRFLAGESQDLPPMFDRLFDRTLGRYAQLLSPADRRPRLDQLPAAHGNAEPDLADVRVAGG